MSRSEYVGLEVSGERNPLKVIRHSCDADLRHRRGQGFRGQSTPLGSNLRDPSNSSVETCLIISASREDDFYELLSTIDRGTVSTVHKLMGAKINIQSSPFSTLFHPTISSPLPPQQKHISGIRNIPKNPVRTRNQNPSNSPHQKPSQNIDHSHTHTQDDARDHDDDHHPPY